MAVHFARAGRRAPIFPTTPEDAMSRMPMLRRVIFALGLAASLGFGATQAIADSRNATDETLRACSPICRNQCEGFDGVLHAGGQCRCCEF
jgi:hypothetical protein